MAQEETNVGGLIGSGAFGFFLGALFFAMLASTAEITATKIALGTDGRIQWETLLAGIAAIGAALWTIRTMREQMSQADRIEADKRLRRERSARATLPLALSEFGQYATNCIRGLSGMLPYESEEDRTRVRAAAIAWQPPDIPENALPIFKECIEFADNIAAASMAQMLRHLQIHASRMSSLIARLRQEREGSIAVSINIEQAILDAGVLYAMGANLFDFSRDRGSPCPNINGRDIINAFHNAGLYDGRHLNNIFTRALSWQSSNDGI